MNCRRMLSPVIFGRCNKVQGDLEEPFEEALEEDVGSLEGDFSSDFVHDLEVGTVLIHSYILTTLVCNLLIHFYTNV